MHRHPRPSANRRFCARRGGLSLLEVAIALAIFVIGAIALLRIFPPGLTVIEDSGKRLAGSRMADNLLARYDAEPLSIPDAIFDAQFDGGWIWNDYPGAMLPARSKGHSLPRSLDQLDDSALGHLRFVRGEGHEIQGPFLGAGAGGGNLTRVLASFVVDRARADVYREAAVQNVSLAANGELDFAEAIYKQSGRGARAISPFANLPSGDGVTGFHEPIIELGNPNVASNLDEPLLNVPTGANYALTLQLADLPGVAERAAFYGGYTNQYHPTASFSISAPPVKAATMGSSLPLALGSDFGATLNGQTLAPNTVYPMVFDANGRASLGINIVSDLLPEGDEFFYINVFNAKACSVRVRRFLCRIPGNGLGPGGAVVTGFGPGDGTDPTPPPPPVAVRPPLDLRATTANGVTRPVVYLASYTWNGGGARNEPLVFPPSDGATDYPQSCDFWPSSFGPRPGNVDRAYWAPTSANPQVVPASLTLRFRQYLGTQSVQNGTSVDLSGLQVPDIYAPLAPGARTYPVEELKNVWIDYNVYDWRYLSESVTQFATPFPGSKQNYPIVLGPMFGFQNTADLREVRLPVGGLLGPVYTINVYQQPNSQPSFAARTLDPRTVPDPAQRAALKELFKQGRLLTSIRDSGPNAAFRFSAYYRTADGWAQQVGAVAARYLPWRDPTNYGAYSARRVSISEPWREYFLAGDGRLYFHPSEAGKTVMVQTTNDGQPYSQFGISDNIIALPANVPKAFAPSGKVVATGAVVGPNVYDVAAPDVGSPSVEAATQTRGRAGLQGRSAWTNGEAYQQQFAP